MAQNKNDKSRKNGKPNNPWHFDVSTGLKTVLGRNLITDDEVAIFELVKNSFDAGADTVNLYFDSNRIVIADNGSGMSRTDLTDKWLFVAYSAKREPTSKADFRNVAADRRHFAGSYGIGRFSSDRLGGELILQTRQTNRGAVYKLSIDWLRFEKNDKEHFEKIPVTYDEAREFELPPDLKYFGSNLKTGTVIEIKKLRRKWNRQGVRQICDLS
jgi:hypothetical protein